MKHRASSGQATRADLIQINFPSFFRLTAGNERSCSGEPLLTHIKALPRHVLHSMSSKEGKEMMLHTVSRASRFRLQTIAIRQESYSPVRAR